MPLVRVEIIKGRSEREVAAIGAAAREALVAVMNVESTREDWSFGNGVAQYLVLPKEEWK